MELPLMAVKPEAPAEGVGAVDRALAILFAFQPGDSVLTLAELARRTGFYKSTLLRLIASLERARMLVRQGQEARWRLGPALIGLGLQAEHGLAPLREMVPAVLRRLAADTGESASFYVREGEFRLCLFREEGHHPVRDHLLPGSLLPLDRGAAAHVLRGAGLSVSIGERDPELAAIAAPVRGTGGVLLGALCLSGTATRFGDKVRREALAAALEREAVQLSRQLGG
ncbi:IclR family transcriptional regulator [Roseomonas sp. M0104]|uniref:IclR family transcriptional regulator n=1 Tax=Teichococcus coralli TaxID=2545983 RepID=A0A845B7K9_9PROT|nr:helix-turn-helix domain-containing protein [Pseudoroseomonas coralli]MXP62054.1 IclR family transcriptional regulator [Pseudoroseomonas coralli]